MLIVDQGRLSTRCSLSFCGKQPVADFTKRGKSRPSRSRSPTRLFLATHRSSEHR